MKNKYISTGELFVLFFKDDLTLVELNTLDVLAFKVRVTSSYLFCCGPC